MLVHQFRKTELLHIVQKMRGHLSASVADVRHRGSDKFFGFNMEASEGGFGRNIFIEGDIGEAQVALQRIWVR